MRCLKFPACILSLCRLVELYPIHCPFGTVKEWGKAVPFRRSDRLAVSSSLRQTITPLRRVGKRQNARDMKKVWHTPPSDHPALLHWAVYVCVGQNPTERKAANDTMYHPCRSPIVIHCIIWSWPIVHPTACLASPHTCYRSDVACLRCVRCVACAELVPTRAPNATRGVVRTGVGVLSRMVSKTG